MCRSNIVAGSTHVVIDTDHEQVLDVHLWPPLSSAVLGVVPDGALGAARARPTTCGVAPGRLGRDAGDARSAQVVVG